MKEYTRACFLQNAELETPVLVRFSRMMGRAGSADTARDVRGFCVKFFTQEGIYDLVGSNLPVFFIRDPEKYPQLLEALSPCPKTNIRDPERLWKFVSENPETMHMITWLYSDRGTLKSYRTMEGHSVHTYIWENCNGERFWVRYHWRPLEGVEDISRQEAEFLAGYDPDAAARDLAITLEDGRNIKYELCVQLISTKQSIESELSLLDPTVTWPEASVPWIKVGVMILRSGVENYREEVENCCFSPGRLIGSSIFRAFASAMTFLSMDDERCRFGSVQGSALAFYSRKLKCDFGISHMRGRSSIPVSWRWRLQSMGEQEKNTLIDNGEELLLLTREYKENCRLSERANKAVGTSLEKWLRL